MNAAFTAVKPAKALLSPFGTAAPAWLARASSAECAPPWLGSELSTLSIAEWNLRPLLKSQASISYKLLVVLCHRVRSVMKTAYTTW